MEWHDWVPWVLVAALVIGIIVWAVVSHYKKKNLLLEMRAKLKEMDEQLKSTHSKLEEEGKARIQAEKKRSATELKILEGVYKKDIEDLSEEKKSEFKKAKEDPGSGIDFMLDFIDDGKPTG